MDPHDVRLVAPPQIPQFLSPQSVLPFRIALIKQTSLAEETVSRNGVTVPYHVVVKGAPFFITMQLLPEDRMNQGMRQPLTFHNIALEVTLLYDCETLKEVAFLKNKPVTFKPSVSEDGMEVTCQCRLKVLTSQHEGSFFRVRIRAKPPSTGKNAYPNYQPIDVITAPYKVISKPEQLKARQQQAKAISATTSSSSGKKRSLTEMLYDTVARLERQQQEHQRMLEHLVSAGVLPPQFLSSSSMSHSPSPPNLLSSNDMLMASSPPTTTTTTRATLSPLTTTTTTATLHDTTSFGHQHDFHQQLDVHKELEMAGLLDLPMDSHTSTMIEKDKEKEQQQQQNKKRKLEEEEKAKEGKEGEGGESFEALFARCMKAYAAIDPDQRANRIRRVMRNATTKQTEEVNEFVDLVYSEGLGRNIGGVDFLSAFATGKDNNSNSSTTPSTTTTPFNISSLTSLMGVNSGNNTHNNNNAGQEGTPAGDGTTCACPNCPHKMELEKIDQFYSEFLS